MNITYVEYGKTSTKNYQSKKITLGAKVGEDEDWQMVLNNLKNMVDDQLSGRKQKASKIRQLADKVESGEIDEEEYQEYLDDRGDN